MRIRLRGGAEAPPRGRVTSPMSPLVPLVHPLAPIPPDRSPLTPSPAPLPIPLADSPGGRSPLAALPRERPAEGSSALAGHRHHHSGLKCTAVLLFPWLTAVKAEPL